MDTTVIAATMGEPLVLVGLSAAAAWDVRKRIIPDTLVLVILGGGLLLRLASPDSGTVAMSVAATGLLFVPLRLLAHFGALGGGDAKLIAAVAIGQPPASLMPLLLDIAAVGGVVAGLYGIRAWSRGRDEHDAGALHHGRSEMPYAPAILVGVVLHELWELAT